MRLKAKHRGGIAVLRVQARFDDEPALTGCLTARGLRFSAGILMAAPALSLSQKLRYGAEAALFLIFMGFFRLIGVDAASAVGGFIGRQIFARTRVTQRARDNLAAAFPKKPRPSETPFSAPCG